MEETMLWHNTEGYPRRRAPQDTVERGHVGVWGEDSRELFVRGVPVQPIDSSHNTTLAATDIRHNIWTNLD